ncbi:maleylpyruvate isomerase family mycothiol-dependent enzyme [Streptomonospora nanhaiensis]|uniref:Maleylpyruvate isomerase n=1 Tax=Streptomonospora nanhaiensis TaxID=1323731 RepID=A0A853BVI9_9ACTN|nr:maleylpyruvate isomerase family mycothiol-dependent enzyme [Streptomonospora nanhaiensis]MBV2365415.1 maleylpyruvate isomerase family mycothiol-dependent enzyme [Streptomonospora nanhaiensis]MBX9390833.1 maleylpyruvate isomerase family mycothiol-dependent enzyme [Streptomonospora nanhaiensis]NYI98990.1 maleylpyruvate isomerase [Streptomonospora nanhaiensis]
MPESAAPARELAWVDQGTALVVELLAALPDTAFAEPTALEGWSRAHVAAHLGGNARALLRLAEWARTGVENPMYAGRAARDAEIEAEAARPPADLRGLVADTAGELRAALDALTPEQWRAPVVTGQGRTVPATELPWLRCREVWVHAVDLGAGTAFADLPPDLLDALLADTAAARLRRGQDPALVLAPTDRERTWSAAPPGAEPVTVRGTAAALAAWITGRGGAGVATAQGAPPPDPGRWL